MKRRGAGKRYLLCVNNKGHRASLEVRKIYRTLPDAEAAGHGLVRVVDESGEDYLFPESYFLSIELPKAASQLFRLAS